MNRLHDNTMIKSVTLGASALLALLLATGCEGAAGEAGPEGPQGVPGDDSGLDQSLPIVDKALAGVGGRDALTALAGVSIEADGTRGVVGEGFSPGDSAQTGSGFALTVDYDYEGGNLRLDYTREILFLGGLQFMFSEIVSGDVGVVEGVDNLFMLPGADMTSVRWAAVTKQQRWLHPHVILQDVVADPSIATEAGVGFLDGSIHELLEVDDPVYPITLWINARTGELAKLTTMENDPLHRDSAIEVHYVDWQAQDGGVRIPSNVFIVKNGEVLHSERRTSIEVNPAFAADRFDFPDGSDPMYTEADAAFGATSSQFFSMFHSIAIPLDFVQTFVMPTELAPGVWHLTGGTHHSMAIEQENGVVIVEAPLYPERSEAILSWVETQFPGKPVTHVIASHHHEDHSAGLRAFVAKGAQVVLHTASVEYMAEIFRAPSTISPDTLAQAPMAPQIAPVDYNASLLLDDPVNPVIAMHIPNVHAEDMLLVYVTSSDSVFQSDLYNPGNGGQALFLEAAVQLHDFIVDEIGGSPTLVGGHGAIAPLSELADYVSAAQ